MKRYEVRDINDTAMGSAGVLHNLDSDTRMAFPYVVWGPYMNFAQGAVFGLFIDYDDALLCAHAMNRELEKAKRG